MTSIIIPLASFVWLACNAAIKQCSTTHKKFRNFLKINLFFLWYIKYNSYICIGKYDLLITN